MGVKHLVVYLPNNNNINVYSGESKKQKKPKQKQQLSSFGTPDVIDGKYCFLLWHIMCQSLTTGLPQSSTLHHQTASSGGSYF